MNNKIILFGGVLLILIGGFVYYALGSDVVTTTNTTATTTPTNVAPLANVQQAGAPVVVTSQNISSSELAGSVTGTVNPRGLFTNYWFEYGTTANFGSKTNIQNIGSGYTTLSTPGYISGLAKNTTYYVRLVAENEYSKATGAQYTFKTAVGSPALVGSLPTIKTLSGNEITRSSATLRGEVNPNQSTTEYWFEYGKTSNFGITGAFQKINATESKTAVALFISDLEPSTNYYYRLNAQNAWGTVNGLTMSIKTSGPTGTAKPVAETSQATGVKTTSATLRGSVNPNGELTTYWFEYSTDSLLGQVLLKSTTHTSIGSSRNESSFEETVSQLVPNTNYFYRIVAENKLGVSYGDRIPFKTK